MDIRAAIVDPLPLLCRGVVASLADAGWAVERPADIWQWLTDAPEQVILLGICVADDWKLLADLHDGRPDVRLLALLDVADIRSYVRAIRGGAIGVLARNGSPAALQRSFEAVLDGQAVLPAEVVQTILMAGDPEADAGGPTDEERMWLRELANGSTVADLAERASYSERMMFRRLRALYLRLSVRGRTEALVFARENGWI